MPGLSWVTWLLDLDKNELPGRIASEIPPTDKAWKLARLVDLAHMYLKAFTVISHLIFTDLILGRGSRLRKLSGRGLLWKRITHCISCKDRVYRRGTLQSGLVGEADRKLTKVAFFYHSSGPICGTLRIRIAFEPLEYLRSMAGGKPLTVKDSRFGQTSRILSTVGISVEDIPSSSWRLNTIASNSLNLQLLATNPIKIAIPILKLKLIITG